MAAVPWRQSDDANDGHGDGPLLRLNRAAIAPAFAYGCNVLHPRVVLPLFTTHHAALCHAHLTILPFCCTRLCSSETLDEEYSYIIPGAQRLADLLDVSNP